MTKKEFIEHLANVPDDALIVTRYMDGIGTEVETEVEPYYNDISNKVFV